MNDDGPKDETVNEIRERYRERTGKQLPDHVLENYDLLCNSGPTIFDLEEAFERGRRTAERGHTKTIAAAAVSIVALGVFVTVDTPPVAAAIVIGAAVGFAGGGILT